MFIQSLYYIRGIAIIFVVFTHSFELAGFAPHSFWEKFISNILLGLGGGTTAFVFLSGFMFHHITYKNYSYKKFMKKRIFDLVIPYLLLSTIPIMYWVFISKSYPELGINNKLYAIFFYYITGRHLFAYWYMPFIFLIFLASPIFVYFIKSNKKIILICFGLIISLFIHRPVMNINTIQSFIFYIPIYMLGIYTSINKEKIYSILKNKESLLLITGVLSAIIQALFTNYTGSSHKDAFNINGIDIFLLQTIFIIFYWMSFLHRFENKKIWILNILAEYTFPIFLLHPFIILIFDKVKRYFGINPEGGIITILLFTFIIIAICIMIAMLIKKIIPKFSRQIIGI